MSRIVKIEGERSTPGVKGQSQRPGRTLRVNKLRRLTLSDIEVK
ncbi:MAG: hypothetical protein ACI4MQ_04630 [Candidatus Coproplasma sp.]